MNKRGTRIKPDWQPCTEDWNFATGMGFTATEVEKIIAEFRDYWIDVPGAKGLKIGWGPTFRNRVRAVADRRGMGRSAIKQHRDTMIEIANDLAFGLGLTAAE